VTSVDVKHFDNTRIKKVFDTKPKFAPKQIIYKALDLFRVAGALLENTHQQTIQFPPIGQRWAFAVAERIRRLWVRLGRD